VKSWGFSWGRKIEHTKRDVHLWGAAAGVNPGGRPGLPPGLASCTVCSVVCEALALRHTQEIFMTIHQNPRDKQPPHTGKVENDTNKLGEQDPTQINQGKRTPESRSDRESHVGGSNQSQSRRGPAGSNNR